MIYEKTEIDNHYFDKSKYRILIVEDSKFLNKLLCTTLKGYGYACESTFTLSETTSLLSKKDFDLILLDLHLPDGEGEDVIGFMKAKPQTKIIVLTADDDKMLREHIYQFGVLDYFNKDNQILHTISKIDKLIESIHENHLTSILIIDDSSLIRRFVSTLLRPRNYKILSAKNAKEGMDILKQETVDLVLLDMELPDIHGTKVLNKIKSDKVLMDTNVLVLSGTDDPNIISAVLKGGASDFVKKPFVSEDLILKVDLWINYSREQHKTRSKTQSLQEFKNAVDRNNIVSITDTNGIITYVNEHFCKLSGYSKDELIGKGHDIVSHEDTNNELYKDLWSTISSGKPWAGTMKNKTKKGDDYYVDMTINPIFGLNNEIKEYIGISHDITALELMHKRLENELKISASSFAEASNLAQKYEKALIESNLIFRTDRFGNILYVNGLFEDVTGYDLQSLKDKNYKFLLNEETPQSTLEDIENALKKQKNLKCDIVGTSIKDEKFWLTTNIVPISNLNNEISEYMFISHDTTQTVLLNKRLKEKEQMLMLQSRHAAMGEMISMIAHQWKQPLSTIAAIASKIQLDSALEDIDPKEQSEHAKNIEAQILYLSQTVDDFKNFFKPSKEKENIKISDIVENSLSLIGKLIKSKDIDIVVEISDKIALTTNPKELLQVLINIFKNAVDAFEDKNIKDKKLTVTSHEDDKYITIEIKDNAGGIADDVINNIFEPYFTTKGDESGTGLGLYICKKIVETQLNGKLDVENIPKGACFSIVLEK